MSVSKKPNRFHTVSLMPVFLVCAMVMQPDRVADAQDMQAVSSRLEAAGNKIQAAAEAGKLAPFEAIAKWHQIKERIVTGAVAGDEITEAEAVLLRIKLVEEEARQMATAANTPAAGGFTAKSMIDYMDKDGDGKISRGEASDDLKPHFATMDTNGDGVIDVKEAQPMADYANQFYGAESDTPDTEPTLSQMDKNGDGKITKDEASEDLKLFFGQYDVNNDGAIDAKEAKALEKYTKSPQAASSKPVPAAGRVTAAQIVGYMDKNNDQKISRKEASEELKPHFDQIDTNKDGVIDVKEAQVMADYMNSQQTGN